jgi:hypothetical protein
VVSRPAGGHSEAERQGSVPQLPRPSPQCPGGGLRDGGGGLRDGGGGLRDGGGGLRDGGQVPSHRTQCGFELC